MVKVYLNIKINIMSLSINGPSRIYVNFPAVQRAADTSCVNPHGGAAAFQIGST